MTNVQKNEVVKAIQHEINLLGSANKASVKCGVSNGSISNIINNKWDLVSDDFWQKIALNLNIQFEGWQVVETTNIKMMHKVFRDAKQESIFISVSHKAGSGKTASIKMVADKDNAIFHIQAGEWAKREFLMELCQTLGIKDIKGSTSIYQIGKKVIEFFAKRTNQKPLLIIDEADKLKAPALRFLIHFYNELEDKVGVVVVGTDNLEKEIKRGAKNSLKGYDEIDSRFGRNFVHLIGATIKDVTGICQANGIHDKALQTAIFKECDPTPIVIENQSFKVIEDMRRLKRIIKRELLKLKNSEYEKNLN